MTNHTPSVATENVAPSGAALLRILADTVTDAGSPDTASPNAGAADATDLLGTRDEAAEWLRGTGLLSVDAALSGSEHNALLRLRDALRDVLVARAAGLKNEDAAARLTRALADGRLVVTVTPGGAAELASSARASYSNLVAFIAIAVAEAW